MKRTELEPGQSRWKKIGGGSLLLTINGKKRHIKPGEIFTAQEHEIPGAFRDVIKPLETEIVTVKKGTPREAPVVREANVKEPIPPSALEYEVQARSGGGYFDVVDKNGKVQNEKALRKDAAEALLESLKE